MPTRVRTEECTARAAVFVREKPEGRLSWRSTPPRRAPSAPAASWPTSSRVGVRPTAARCGQRAQCRAMGRRERRRRRRHGPRGGEDDAATPTSPARCARAAAAGCTCRSCVRSCAAADPCGPLARALRRRRRTEKAARSTPRRCSKQTADWPTYEPVSSWKPDLGRATPGPPGQYHELKALARGMGTSTALRRRRKTAYSRTSRFARTRQTPFPGLNKKSQ